jgi:hypothetical protein
MSSPVSSFSKSEMRSDLFLPPGTGTPEGTYDSPYDSPPGCGGISNDVSMPGFRSVLAGLQSIEMRERERESARQSIERTLNGD